MKNERRERCETCRFWDNDGGKSLVNADVNLGHCHRLPPVPQPGDPDDHYGAFPITSSADWCGEWRAAESKP